MHRMTVVVLAAAIAICYGSNIENSIETAKQNAAAINVTSGSLVGNITIPLAKQNVSSNLETDNANMKMSTQIKKENVSPEKLSTDLGLINSLKENKTVSKRDFNTDSSSENDKIPPLSPFLPFLPLGERQDNPFLPFIHNVMNKKSDKKEDLSQTKADEKPFLFFDFFFNIREMPIFNGTTSSNLTKPTKKEAISIDIEKPTLEESSNEKWLKRSVREDESFFDDSKLFHPLDLEEFLPRPDFFFFPDSFLHRPTSKRSTRRKRDEKTKTLRFADETRKILLRKKRAGQRHDILRNLLAEKMKKGTEERKADLKKEENPVILMKKVVKIGEIYPQRSNNEEKNENGKKVVVRENTENSQEGSKQKQEKISNDEKKQGLN